MSALNMLRLTSRYSCQTVEANLWRICVYVQHNNSRSGILFVSSTGGTGIYCIMGNKPGRDADLGAVGTHTHAGDDAAAHMTELSGLSSRVEVRGMRVQHACSANMFTTLISIIGWPMIGSGEH